MFIFVLYSVGRLLRSITDSAPRANTESYAVKEALAAGEMAPEKAVNIILETNLKQFADKNGIIIDGFPRNMQQVKYFEDKYKLRPPIILLDCSKLQLGRGRIDDTVSSFRRRLELFREQTLPMLKAMDNSNRLQIIDGDTDSPSVQREFEKSIRNHIQNLTGNQMNHVQQPISRQPAPVDQTDAILQDLENNMPGAVPTISHHVSLMNGHIKNRNTSANNHLANNNNYNNKNTNHMNGDIGQTGQRMDFRHMLEEAERYPVDSYM
ncbi:Adenylate kinase isoenzyme 5 [Lucilia cuprina]|nr:Adenylate kinase isoenzyme 5 [Lucilia cuprina]